MVFIEERGWRIKVGKMRHDAGSEEAEVVKIM